MGRHLQVATGTPDLRSFTQALLISPDSKPPMFQPIASTTMSASAVSRLTSAGADVIRSTQSIIRIGDEPWTEKNAFLVMTGDVSRLAAS